LQQWAKRSKKPFRNVVEFKSLNKLNFISFAKSELFGQDLYSELVAPNLQTDLLVETWPNGPGKLNSSCLNTYHVLNIDSINFKSTSKPITFTTRKDHSKWAISSSVKKNYPWGLKDKMKYVCIGDINHMATQYKRGGGTVCFSDKNVWKAFYDLVCSFEACTR